MVELKPQFSISEFENYGSADPFLTQEQAAAVIAEGSRVQAQVDWVAQLLGWSGAPYWANLADTVAQKRALLTGTFGVYNALIYPEVLEIRNWSNRVVVKSDPRIIQGVDFLCGSIKYPLLGLEIVGDTYHLNIGELTDEFLVNFSGGQQLSFISPTSLPSPFYRPTPGTSGDATFLVKVSGTELTLFPQFDTSYLFPYRMRTLFAGSRYYFNAPLQLTSGDVVVNPVYDFGLELWYLQIPSDYLKSGLALNSTLTTSDSLSSVEVYVQEWIDPSDWRGIDLSTDFAGVWSNKGGYLPFNFVFDCLDLHGFNEENSIKLLPLNRDVPLSVFLDKVYYNLISTSPAPPARTEPNQLWWNSSTGNLAVLTPGCLSCGPWVSITYDNYPDQITPPDYVLPDVAAFESGQSTLPPNKTVTILDGSGLGTVTTITGLTSPLSQPVESTLIKSEDGFWKILHLLYADVPMFEIDAVQVPSGVIVTLRDSSGLSPVSPGYQVDNLKITVSEEIEVNLVKEVGSEVWFISPINGLRYIANTGIVQDGLLAWDYLHTPLSSAPASIFYDGAWTNIGSTAWSGTPSPTLNPGVIIVYCDGDLVAPGASKLTEDYLFSYSVNPGDGTFSFVYNPITFEGMANFPVVEISDSVTTAFRADVSDHVFSGPQYTASPNVKDSETPLRIWKSDPLFCSDLPSDGDDNLLVADLNTGAGDNNWERYFLRLPPSYQRNGAEWQKVGLICQNFGYWGTPLFPESMQGPPQDQVPAIYENVFISGANPTTPTHIYAEDYLFSAVAFGPGGINTFSGSQISRYDSSQIGDFSSAVILSYDTLHSRTADTAPQSGAGFGDWNGKYYRASECTELTGFLSNDVQSGALIEMGSPTWDASMYKYPVAFLGGDEPSEVDSNHYKLGFAYFIADLSAADEAVFDLTNPTCRRFSSQAGKSSYKYPGNSSPQAQFPLPIPVSPPPPSVVYNFEATWRNNSNLTSFNISTPS